MAMRNLLALVGLVVVGFGAVGWYCGWYKLNVGKDTDGTLQIKTEVDTKRVTEDSSTFFQRVGKVLGERNSQPASSLGTTPGPIATPETTSQESGNFRGGWILGSGRTTPISTGNR